MEANKLKGLLVLDEDRTALARSHRQFDDFWQWCFIPTGEFRGRIFFVWITKDREIGGTRCRPDYKDRAEPWQWHAFLPQKFLRALLDMCPPEEVAAAIAKSLAK